MNQIWRYFTKNNTFGGKSNHLKFIKTWNFVTFVKSSFRRDWKNVLDIINDRYGKWKREITHLRQFLLRSDGNTPNCNLQVIRTFELLRRSSNYREHTTRSCVQPRASRSSSWVEISSQIGEIIPEPNIILR